MEEEQKLLIFDKRQIFSDEIQSIVEHLKSLLLHYDIPYFFAAAVETDETETSYVYEVNDIWSISMRIKDNKIPDFIKVVNGFKTVLPGDENQLDK